MIVYIQFTNSIPYLHFFHRHELACLIDYEEPREELLFSKQGNIYKSVRLFTTQSSRNYIIGTSLSEPHCYVANRGKRNALWCVRTRNFSTVIKIPSACDRNFYQFVVNLPIVFPSSQLLRQFAWLRISQDASHFARRNLLAELVEQ